MCVFLVSYRGLLTLSVLGGNLPVPTHVPVAIVSASLMDFSHLVSFSSLCLPLLFLPYHIHVFPLGLIKRLSSRGEGRRAEREERRRGGMMAARKSGPYYPIRLDRGGWSGGPLPVNQ